MVEVRGIQLSRALRLQLSRGTLCFDVHVAQNFHVVLCASTFMCPSCMVFVTIGSCVGAVRRRATHYGHQSIAGEVSLFPLIHRLTSYIGGSVLHR